LFLNAKVATVPSLKPARRYGQLSGPANCSVEKLCSKIEQGRDKSERVLHKDLNRGSDRSMEINSMRLDCQYDTTMYVENLLAESGGAQETADISHPLEERSR
jgi:hypothetical protein